MLLYQCAAEVKLFSTSRHHDFSLLALNHAAVARYARALRPVHWPVRHERRIFLRPKPTCLRFQNIRTEWAELDIDESLQSKKQRFAGQPRRFAMLPITDSPVRGFFTKNGFQIHNCNFFRT